MKHINNKVCAILLALIVLFSCTKNDVPVIEKAFGKHKIAETVWAGTAVRLELFSEYDSLFVGYNPLYIRLTDTLTKAAVTTAGITFLPIMDMGTMKHACPVEAPVWDAANQSFKGAAIFTMATMAQMGWSIKITTAINGRSFTSEIPVVVKGTGNAVKLLSAVKDNTNTTHYVVLVSPQWRAQKIGINDLEIAVYKQNSLMDYSAVDGLTIGFVPTMPSMGHSSPNNVNPAAAGHGHYKGKVNYTMTGDWQLDFSLGNSSSVFTNHAFIDVVF